MDSSTPKWQQTSRKPKLLVIMGPTGSGKSKLSIDLATRFFPESEIINSDKIQLYRGLDITTNKIPMPDRRGVPHHLLGVADPKTDFSPSLFRAAASATISAIGRRGRLPILVGGSNSIIYALLSKQFESDIFHPTTRPHPPKCTELRYNCCFLWVDMSMPILDKYLVKRVDDMLGSGMFAELTQYFKTEGFSSSDSLAVGVGLSKAIGVPEFESYFRRYCYLLFAAGSGEKNMIEENEDRLQTYEDSVRLIKDNTCQLARRQVEKIQRLRDNAGWDFNRVDATAPIKAAITGGDAAGLLWERQVVVPSVEIVRQFLEE